MSSPSALFFDSPIYFPHWLYMTPTPLTHPRRAYAHSGIRAYYHYRPPNPHAPKHTHTHIHHTRSCIRAHPVPPVLTCYIRHYMSHIGITMHPQLPRYQPPPVRATHTRARARGYLWARALGESTGESATRESAIMAIFPLGGRRQWAEATGQKPLGRSHRRDL